MKVVEVKKDKEWLLYPEGEKPIRLVVDRRMKPVPRWGPIYKGGTIAFGKGGAIASYKKREVRVAPGVSETAVGHEVGHILLDHGKGEDEEQPQTLDRDFIREELEAEYLAYALGFPKRRWKIEFLKELALDIGMTEKQFNELKRKVRGRFL